MTTSKSQPAAEQTQTQPTTDVWAEMAESQTQEASPQTNGAAEPDAAQSKDASATSKAKRATSAKAKSRGKGGAAKKAPAKRSGGGRKPNVTLADINRAYMEHLEERGASLGTKFSYGQELSMAESELGADLSAAKLTKKLVEGYFASDRVCKLRSGRPKARPSVDKSIRVLTQALIFAADSGLIAKSPIEKPARKSRRSS